MARQASRAGAKAVAKVGASKIAKGSVAHHPAKAQGKDARGDSSILLQEVPLGTFNFKLGAVVKWAVRSLYQEEALPRGPLLQWLLQMMLGVKLGHTELRTIIQAEEGVHAEPSTSRKLNFHAVLDQEPAGFKGFVSDSDVVDALSEELWAEAAVCLSKGGWPKADDSAHKYYVVASWLQDVSEKFRSWSLGRVLAVVRFAAQADCLLGHRGGLLVPYEHSEECERRVNAWTGLPTHVQDGESYVQTWSQLKECLHELFSGHQEDTLEVSKLKMMFRAHLRLELSETVFGHQCLSRLLGDENLADSFTLETCTSANRYTLRQKNGSSSAGSAASSADGSVDGGCSEVRAVGDEAIPNLRPPPGLSSPCHIRTFSPPPGLLPKTMAVQDISCWPSTNVATPVSGTSIALSDDKTDTNDVPPGLSPEKTVRKTSNIAATAPPTEPPPPAPSKASEKTWHWI